MLLGVAIVAAACARKREAMPPTPTSAVALPAATALNVTSGPSAVPLSDTSARILWSTGVPTTTQLRYGTQPDKLDRVATDVFGGTTHSVILRDLAPHTTYYYRIGDAPADPKRRAANFRTDAPREHDMPPPSPKR
jgi:hypothetical protein